jgi:hypothetical protein
MKHWKQIICIFVWAILAIMVITCNRGNVTTQQPTVSETDVITSAENYTKIVNEDLSDFIGIWINNYGGIVQLNNEVYKKILLNETGFYASNNRITYPHDLNYSLFAVLDMTSDGIPELVLHNTSNGDSLVIHYYNGTLYGKDYSFRAMRNLKTDGTFAWSNDASNSGLGKLRHLGADQKTTMFLAEYSSLLEGIETYRIRGQQVSREDFYAYTAIQDAKEDVVWYELTIENINNLDALQKISAITFPPPIDYFQYIDFKPMYSVNDISDLRFWGWSKNSNVAYTINMNLEPMEGSRFTAVIFNTIDDTILWRSSINSYNFLGNYNEVFNDLIDNFKIKALQNGIEFTKADFKSLPIRHNNQTVNIIVETKTVELHDSEYIGIGSYKIIAEIDGRRKTVHEKILVMPAEDVKIYGYFISPFEDRVLIVAGEYVYGFEGYDVRYVLIGCHLSIGFE